MFLGNKILPCKHCKLIFVGFTPFGKLGKAVVKIGNSPVALDLNLP